jgi:hypothetical protein
VNTPPYRMILRTSSAALALLTLLLVTTTGVSGMPAAQLDTEVPHLATNRTQFEVCVDVDGANLGLRGVTDAVRSVIRTELRDHPGWRLSRRNPDAIAVAAGCPFRSLALVNEFTHPSARDVKHRPNKVTQPSPFTTHVYVTSTNEVNRIFSGVPVPRRTFPEEYLCEDGGVCAEVTTSLIIDAQTLLDRAALARWLRAALHLEPPS